MSSSKQNLGQEITAALDKLFDRLIDQKLAEREENLKWLRNHIETEEAVADLLKDELQNIGDEKLAEEVSKTIQAVRSSSASSRDKIEGMIAEVAAERSALRNDGA